MSYSYATRKSYTRISPLHGKENYWLFRGVYRLPHLYLTRIQQQLLTIASIAPPTHMLPLFAITAAPHLRFGSSLHFITLVTLCDTATIHKYPCFVVLTYSACASARWFSVSFTEFLVYICISNFQDSVSLVESSIATRRHLLDAMLQR